jgi:hypothetical protein
MDIKEILLTMIIVNQLTMILLLNRIENKNKNK